MDVRYCTVRYVRAPTVTAWPGTESVTGRCQKFCRMMDLSLSPFLSYTKTKKMKKKKRSEERKE